MKQKRKFEDLMLITDVGGTLLDSNNEVTEKNQEAIRYFTEQGGAFTISSGKTVEACRRYAEFINVPAILGNGTLIYDYQTDKTMWSSYLDNSCRPLLKRLIQQFPELGIEIYTTNDIYVYQYNAMIEHHSFLDSFAIKTIDGNLSQIPKRFYTRVVLGERHERLKEAVDYLSGEMNRLHFPFYLEYILPELVDFRSKDGGKHRALHHLSSITGTSIKDIIVVGGRHNDLRLFASAGHSYAVSNGDEELKKTADHVTVSHDHSAIAAVIGELDQLYS